MHTDIPCGGLGHGGIIGRITVGSLRNTALAAGQDVRQPDQLVSGGEQRTADRLRWVVPRNLPSVCASRLCLGVPQNFTSRVYTFPRSCRSSPASAPSCDKLALGVLSA